MGQTERQCANGWARGGGGQTTPDAAAAATGQVPVSVYKTNAGLLFPMVTPAHAFFCLLYQPRHALLVITLLSNPIPTTFFYTRFIHPDSPNTTQRSLQHTLSISQAIL